MDRVHPCNIAESVCNAVRLDIMARFATLFLQQPVESQDMPITADPDERECGDTSVSNRTRLRRGRVLLSRHHQDYDVNTSAIDRESKSDAAAASSNTQGEQRKRDREDRERTDLESTLGFVRVRGYV